MINKGEVILLSSGEYSGYTIEGVYRATMSVTKDQLHKIASHILSDDKIEDWEKEGEFKKVIVGLFNFEK
jgi:hypothetical protein